MRLLLPSLHSAFLVLAIVAFANLATAAPLFQLVEIPLPENAEVFPKAINQNGDFVGYFRDTNGVSKAFYWNAGVLKILNAFEGEAEAWALNNRGQVVGRAKQVGIWRAWLNENGSDANLAPEGSESEATSINDDGAIVGDIVSMDGVENGYLLKPEKLMIVCCSGGPNGPAPMRALAINNKGVIIGDHNGAGFLIYDAHTDPNQWTLFWPSQQENALNYGDGSTLNASNAVAGFVRYRVSNKQACIWHDTMPTILGAPLEEPSEAFGLNDQEEAVGRAGNRGMFWKNGMGVALDSLVELPAGVTITAGVSINNNSVILVSLSRDGKSGVGLLKPLVDTIDLPLFKIVEPIDESVQTNSNNLTVRVASETPGATSDHALFVLHQRWRQDASGGGDWWTPPAYYSNPTQTNNVDGLSTVFPNIVPGQYALAASVESGGMKLYLPGVFVAVTGEARLRPYLVNLAGEFVFGLSGTPGKLYTLEASTNLQTWSTIDQGTEGGLFHASGPRTNSLFVRARPVASGLSFFGRPAPDLPPAPKTFPTGQLEFWSLDNQIRYVFQLQDDGTFTGTPPSGNGVEGTYTYSADDFVGHFRVIDPRQSWSFDATLEYSTSAYFRAIIHSGVQTQTLIGRVVFWNLP